MRRAAGPFALCLALGLALALALGACAQPEASGDGPALDAIARARAAHGVEALDGATLAFSFRDVPFAVRAGRRFAYSRTLTDSLGRSVEETVDNDGTRRRVDGQPAALDEASQARVATAVNSVAYFALLPAPLADPAVRARTLAPDTLRGEPYTRVEVRFAQEGGGADWEDRFVYWFHATRHTMDYLAYTYALSPGADGPNDTGTRFREAFNARDVGGFRVQDYRNFTADAGTPLEDMGRLFEADALRLVSDVVLEDVRLAR